MIQPLKIKRKTDNDAKIAQIVRENIPATEYMSADEVNSMVGKINEMVPAINVSNGGFQGPLSINEKRVDSGFYIPTQSGIYINADNVVVDLSQGINFVTYDGDKWDVAVVPIEMTQFVEKESLNKPFGIATLDANGRLIQPEIGKIEKDNMGLISGRETFNERISNNSSIVPTVNTPNLFSSAVLFFDFYAKSEDLLRDDWYIMHVGYYKDLNKFYIQLYDNLNKVSKDFLFDTDNKGISEFIYNESDAYIKLIIDLDIWKSFNRVDLNYKKIHFKESTNYQNILYLAESNGFYFKEYFISNELAAKVFKELKVEIKGEDKDYYITSAGLYSNGKFLLQLRTDKGDYNNLYSEDVDIKNDIKDYHLENENMKVSISVDFSILKSNFITSFKVFPYKRLYKHITIDESNHLENIEVGSTYLALFKQIGVIGDSYASGEIECIKSGENSTTFLDVYYNSWGQVIARKNGIKAVNFSSGGLTAKDWFNSKWKSELAISENLCDAYFIDLGRNDMRYTEVVGNISDIHLDNYDLNPDTYYGNMGKIISYVREISSTAKIFLLTIPNGNYTGNYRGFADAIREISTLYSNCFVIDLEKWVPQLTPEHLSTYYNGHPNSLGYMWFATMINTYCNWIVKNNLDNFRDVSLINTEYILKTNN